MRSENAGDDEAVFVASFVIDEAPVKEKGLLHALVVMDADKKAKA